MPSEYVRPKPSKVPPLDKSAIDAYAAMGWTVTEAGGIDAGVNDGPCAKCRRRTTVYGPHGKPLCETCDKEQKERAERLRREQRERRGR